MKLILYKKNFLMNPFHRTERGHNRTLNTICTFYRYAENHLSGSLKALRVSAGNIDSLLIICKICYCNV